jgi:hypothetical protein
VFSGAAALLVANLLTVATTLENTAPRPPGKGFRIYLYARRFGQVPKPECARAAAARIPVPAPSLLPESAGDFMTQSRFWHTSYMHVYEHKRM